MNQHLSTITVLYSDTDQMGIVHHANYLKYYEAARWNLFRDWKIPYKLIEESGFLLPVHNINIQYIQPTYYDEVLTIETSVRSFKGAKISFEHSMYNASKKLVNQAVITVAFIYSKTRKPCRPPEFISEKIKMMVQGNAILHNAPKQSILTPG